MSDKYTVLKNIYGYDSFRPAQEEIIDNILSGRDVLGVMPTGAGKSLCFQIPALLMDGITVVISPLISLMSDQVTALVQAGAAAAYLNSSLTFPQQMQVIKNLRSGMYKIIYVAPERLETESFIEAAGDIKISMIAVDEAHCISQWGQDFRPSYMNILSFAAALPYRPIISAFTATATERVRRDISDILKLNDPYTITTGFDRANLYFGVTPVREPEKYPELKRLIESYNGRSGIVYCSTRKNVDTITEKLNRDGIPCLPYHAGLSDEVRQRNQNDFIYDNVKIIIATNAFGMGIDKSNVSFVIHYNMPKDMESYYQEAGRAGRDGEPAECTLLFGRQDIRLNQFLIENGSEDTDIDPAVRRQRINSDMKRLRKMIDYCETASCLRGQILRYFGERGVEECGNCSCCLSGRVKTDMTTEAQKVLSCVYRMEQRFGMKILEDVLLGKNDEKYTGEKITAAGLDKLSTYGIMNGTSQKRLKIIIKTLISDNYLRLEGEDYPVVKLTAKAGAVLKGQERVYMFLPPEKAESEKKASRKQLDGKVLYQVDEELMAQLKDIRKRLAGENNIPAYMVFSDATLRDMCLKRPENKTEMLGVTGVGSMKLQKFGEPFIECIAAWNSTHGKGTKMDMEKLSQAAKNPLHTIAAAAGGFVPSEESISLTALGDMFIALSGTDVKNKPVREAISGWLIGNGYLKEGKDRTGMSRKEITERSAEIGIINVRRTARDGNVYEYVVYTPRAQKFIAEHFDEIAEIENIR